MHLERGGFYIVKRVYLAENKPNPFRVSTTIEFGLPQTLYTRLIVFDAAGRKVAALVEGEQPKGIRSVVWNAKGVDPGVYFLRLEAGSYNETRKMVLLK